MDSNKTPKLPEPHKGVSVGPLLIGGAVILALIVAVALIVAAILAWPYISPIIQKIWPAANSTLAGLPPGSIVLANGSIVLPNGTMLPPNSTCVGSICTPPLPGGRGITPPLPQTGGSGAGTGGQQGRSGTSGTPQTQTPAPPLGWNAQPPNLPAGVGFPAGPQPGAPNGAGPDAGNGANGGNGAGAAGGNANACVVFGWPCNATTACCTGMTCDRGICLGHAVEPPPAPAPPAACQAAAAACSAASPCCMGSVCSNGACVVIQPQTCRLPEQACTAASPCCLGLACDNSVCKIPGLPAQTTCLDTDMSDNAAAGVAALVQNNAIIMQQPDICKDANTLYEYDCTPAITVSRNEVACPFGCQNSACLSAPPNQPPAPGQGGAAAGSNCTDTDGGANMLLKGSIISGAVTIATDYCDNARFLEEYTCGPNGEVIKKGYSLPAGMKCDNGTVSQRADSEVTCNDTDGGDMPDVGGEVITSDGVTHPDVCTGLLNMTEYYCGPTSARSSAHSCANGCVNNACAPARTEPPAAPPAEPPAVTCQAIPQACGITPDGVYHGNCCTGLRCIRNSCQNQSEVACQADNAPCGMVNGIYQGVCCSNWCANGTCQPHAASPATPPTTPPTPENPAGTCNIIAMPCGAGPSGVNYGTCCDNYTCTNGLCQPATPDTTPAPPAAPPTGFCQIVATPCGAGSNGANYGTCCDGYTCTNGLCQSAVPATPPGFCQAATQLCGTTPDGIYQGTCCQGLQCTGSVCQLAAPPPATPPTTPPAAPPYCNIIAMPCGQSPNGMNYGTCCENYACTNGLCQSTTPGTTPPPTPGTPPAAPPATPPAAVENCVDGDNGQNYGVAGTMSYGNGQTVADWCVNTSMLVEYYCYNTAPASEYYTCPAGMQCMNAACVASPPAGGAPGTTPPTTPPANTYCGIIAMPCGAGPNGANYGPCCDGYTCTNGLCQSLTPGTPPATPPGSPPAAACYDSDGGINFEQQGILHHGNDQPAPEVCLNITMMVEYYCNSDGSYSYADYTCPPERPRCYDATCIPAPPASECQPLSTLCGLSLDGLYHGTCCEGYMCENGVCANTPPVTPTAPVCIQAGYSCGNEQGNASTPCCAGLSCTDFKCTTPAGPTAPPASCLPFKASCVASNQTGYDTCCSGLSCMDGECKNISGTTNQRACNESDGGNDQYWAGTTQVMMDGGSPLIRSDWCDSPTSSVLHEYYCQQDATMNVVDITCAYGCVNNACRTAPLPPASCMLVNAPCGPGYDPCCTGLTCTNYQCKNLSAPSCQSLGGACDSYMTCCSGLTCNSNGYCQNATYTPPASGCTETDSGLDYNHSGSTTGPMYVGSASQTYPDTCRDSTTLNEYYCNAGLVALSSYYCPSGCQNNACYTPPPYVPPTCNDTDGGRVYGTQGTVTLGNPPGSTDTCINSNTLQEYYCVPNGYSSEYYTCPAGQTCQTGRCAAAPCNDTDGGYNLQVKGTLTFNGANMTDYCIGSTLIEYYCWQSTYSYNNTACPSPQTCQAGRCIIVYTPPPG